MNQSSFAKKIDVPGEHWDRLFAPSACLVMITTVDGEGRINAGSFGTCVRVCHDPVFIAFTVGRRKTPASTLNRPASLSSTCRLSSVKFWKKSESWDWSFHRGSTNWKRPGLRR